MPDSLPTTAERMSLGPSLEALAARWAAHPEPGVFAPLAEGLLKRGDLDGAARILVAGLARYPGHAAGLTVRARVALASGDRPLAERALAELLERDPSHPVGLGLLADLRQGAGDPPGPAPAATIPEEAPAESPLAVAAGDPDTPMTEALESTDDANEEEPFGPEVAIVTESLAALYQRQGHLEQAMAAYAELAARDPSNDTLSARHEALRRELATRRPLPFSARESGGRSTAAWLQSLAAVRPEVTGDPESFDAFFEPPPAPADATADYDAFQRWLEELGR